MIFIKIFKDELSIKIGVRLKKERVGKRLYKMLAGAVGGGALVTLISGAINITPYGYVGAQWYGFPAAWISKLIILNDSTTPVWFRPWKLDPVGLAIDLIVWILIVAGLLVLVRHFNSDSHGKKHRNKKK